MPIKEIKFQHDTQYHGRNGVGHQAGIQVLNSATYPIELRPVNSRLDPVQNCCIRVDRAALPELIRLLTAIADGTAGDASEFIKPLN